MWLVTALQHCIPSEGIDYEILPAEKRQLNQY